MAEPGISPIRPGQRAAFGRRTPPATLKAAAKQLSDLAREAREPSRHLRARDFQGALNGLPQERASGRHGTREADDTTAINTLIEIIEPHRDAALVSNRTNVSWDAAIFLSAYRYLIAVYEARGRYLMGLQDFSSAKNWFDKARNLYRMMLDSSASHPLGANSSQFDKILNFAAENQRALQATLTPQELFELKKFRVYMEISSIAPETTTTFGPLYEDPYKILDKELDLKSQVDDIFSRVPIAGFDKFKDGKLTLPHARLLIAKANFYIKIARILKIRNRELAYKAINLAIEILREVLGYKLLDESSASALLSLAWAYGSFAEMGEEEERGYGRENAIRAAAIYKAVLYSDRVLLETLDSDLKELISKHLDATTIIKTNLAKVLAGQPIYIEPSQGLDDRGDIMAKLATNELELALNLGSVFAIARMYDDAEALYNQVANLDPDRRGGYHPLNRSNYPVLDTIFYRARTGLAKTYLFRASDIYAKNEDAGQARILSEKALKLLNEASLWYENKAKNASQVSDVLREKYTFEYIKVSDSIAWAKSLLGRIEQQERGEGIEENAAKNRRIEGPQELEDSYEMYRAIHLTRGDYVVPDSSQTGYYVNTVTKILGKRLGQMEQDTGLMPSKACMRRADALANQRKYEAAIRELRRIQKGDVDYYAAQIRIQELRLASVQQMFNSQGKLDKVLGELSSINSQISTIRSEVTGLASAGIPNSVLLLRLKLLEAQVYGAYGWHEILNMDRNSANQYFDRAISIYRELADPARNAQYTSAMEQIFLTDGKIHLTLADLYRIRYQREYDNLSLAESEYEAAINAFGSEQNTRGVLQARIGFAETQGNKLKLLAREEAFTSATRSRQSELDLVLGFLQDGKYVQELMEDVKAAINLGSFRLAFRAARVVSYLWGVRGGIEQGFQDEDAIESFCRAADITNAFLGKDPMYIEGFSRKPQTSWEANASDFSSFLALLRENKDAFSDPYLLLLADTSTSFLDLDVADLEKSSADSFVFEREDALPVFDASQKTYNKTYSELRISHPLLSSLSETARFNAAAAYVEAEISRGQILEEENDDSESAKARYEKALDLISETVVSLVAIPIDDLPKAALNQRVINVVLWAINSLGRIFEDFALNDFDPQPAFKVALLIYSALFNGTKPDEADPLFRALYTDDPDVIAWVNEHKLKDNLFAMMNRLSAFDYRKNADEIAFYSNANVLSLSAGYIGTLISGKFYGKAAREYEEIIQEFSARPTFSVREASFLVGLHASIGDVYLYKLGHYKEARAAYDKGIIAIASVLSRDAQVRASGHDHNVRNVDDALGIIGDHLDVLVESPKYRQLLEYYLKIINSYGKLLVEDLASRSLDNSDFYKAIGNFEHIVYIFRDEAIYKDDLKRKVAGLTDEEINQLFDLVPGYSSLYSCKINFKSKLDSKIKDPEKRKKLLAVWRRTNLRKDQKLTRVLVTALLNIADVYNYNLKDKDKALEYYNRALSETRDHITTRQYTTRFTALSYLGIGNAYRSRVKMMSVPDTENARKYYQLGVNAFSGLTALNSENKKILAQLYEGFALTYAEDSDYKKAYDYIELAWNTIRSIPRSVFSYDIGRENIENSIKSSSAAINSKRTDLSYKFGAGYGYSGVSAPGLQLEIPLSRKLKLYFDPTSREGESIGFYSTTVASDMPRLEINRWASGSFGVDFKDEADKLTTTARFGYTFANAGYDLWAYTQNPSFTAYSETERTRDRFKYGSFDFSLGVAPKFDNFIQSLTHNRYTYANVGLNVSGSLPTRTSQSPYVEAELQGILESQDKNGNVVYDGATMPYDDAKAAILASNSYNGISLDANIQPSLYHSSYFGEKGLASSSFGLKFGFERTPQETTVYGIYPLDNSKLLGFYISSKIGTTLHLPSNSFMRYPFDISASLDAKVGSNRQKAEASFGFNIFNFNPMSIHLGLSTYYSRQNKTEGEDTSTWGLNAGLKFSFDR